MKEVVFDTLQEAIELQERDYNIRLSQIDNPLARQQTTGWAEPRQRIDGKWAYLALSNVDYNGYTLEDYNESNYT